MRKIVQIATGTMGSDIGGCGSIAYNIIALCDDGSVWQVFGRNDEEWHRLPDIPQEAAHED